MQSCPPEGSRFQERMRANPNPLRDLHLVQAKGLVNGETLLHRQLRFSRAIRQKEPPSGECRRGPHQAGEFGVRFRR